MQQTDTTGRPFHSEDVMGLAERLRFCEFVNFIWPRQTGAKSACQTHCERDATRRRWSAGLPVPRSGTRSVSGTKNA